MLSAPGNVPPTGLVGFHLPTCSPMRSGRLSMPFTQRKQLFTGDGPGVIFGASRTIPRFETYMLSPAFLLGRMGNSPLWAVLVLEYPDRRLIQLKLWSWCDSCCVPTGT